jgi:hypothetical protein
MNRTLGLTLVAGLVLGLNSTIQAQTFPTDYFGHDGYNQGGYGYDNLPYGGFGHEYTQGPPVSGIVMDQWGQVIGTTFVAPGPIVATDQAASTQPVTRQNVRSRFRKTPMQPRYAVTTGSLGVSGSGGVAVFGPGMRERSYGWGYGLSPYGTTQYFGPWKGLTLGY